MVERSSRTSSQPMSVIWDLYRIPAPEPTADSVFATGMIGVGVYGTIIGCVLLTMPSQFYEAEKAGLKLVKLIGLKTLAGVRGVSFFMIVISLLMFFAPGVYFLFVQ